VQGVLKQLKLLDSAAIILIDAQRDNKPSDLKRGLIYNAAAKRHGIERDVM
jgi:hypothetical protein